MPYACALVERHRTGADGHRNLYEAEFASFEVFNRGGIEVLDTGTDKEHIGCRHPGTAATFRYFAGMRRGPHRQQKAARASRGWPGVAMSGQQWFWQSRQIGCVMREVFGPFVTVSAFSTEDEAIGIANGVADALGIGMVWINCYKRVNGGA